MAFKEREFFEALGITKAKDKIVALCNAPALFISGKSDYTEDFVMVHFVTAHVWSFIKQEYFPSEYNEDDIVRRDLKYHHIAKHIENSVFSWNPNLRDIIYSMRDPTYVDKFLEWIVEVRDKAIEIDKEYFNKFSAFCLQETGVPKFYYNSAYKKHYDQAQNNGYKPDNG